MTIGERIKQRRIELNMSQEELAKKTGYKSRSSIQKIENSRTLPLKKVNLMARALDCKPSYLMGWNEWEEYTPPEDTPTFRADIHNKVILTDTEKQIIEKFRSMPQHERDFYTRMILYYELLKGDNNANR